MSQASKFKSNHLNSNELPEKDLKVSSSSSSNNSRSNSSSRGGSSTSINKIKPEAIIDAYNTINQRQQYNNNNTNNNNNNNNNLIMSRNFSSQMDIPLCNSTSIGTASSIIAANNRNLMQSTASYLNYPQNANLAYANYPLVNPNAATAHHIDRLLVNRLSGLNMQSPNTIYSTPNQNNYMMVIIFYEIY